MCFVGLLSGKLDHRYVDASVLSENVFLRNVFLHSVLCLCWTFSKSRVLLGLLPCAPPPGYGALWCRCPALLRHALECCPSAGTMHVSHVKCGVVHCERKHGSSARGSSERLPKIMSQRTMSRRVWIENLLFGTTRGARCISIIFASEGPLDILRVSTTCSRVPFKGHLWVCCAATKPV